MSNIANIVKQAIDQYGEPIELTVKATGDTTYLRASVQSQTQDPLINDFDQTGYMVYIAPADLLAPPVKFDRVKVRGVVTALDEDPRVECLEGVPIAYVIRIRG